MTLDRVIPYLQDAGLLPKDGEKFNPYHSPATGQFSVGGTGGAYKGTIKGGSEAERQSVRDVMGRIPLGLLPNNLTIQIGSIPTGVGASAAAVGLYRGPALLSGPPRHIINISPSALRLGKIETEHVVFHEAGHAVHLGGGAMKAGVESKRIVSAWGDFKKISAYANKDADEGFAEGFASRMAHGTKFGTKSENIFSKLGV